MIEGDICYTFDWIPQTFNNLDPLAYLHEANAKLESLGASLYIRDYGQWKQDGNGYYVIHFLVWVPSIRKLNQCLQLLTDYPFTNFRTFKGIGFAGYSPVVSQPHLSGLSTFAQEWIGQYNDAILFGLPLLGTGLISLKQLSTEELSTVFDLFERWTYRVCYDPRITPQALYTTTFMIATRTVTQWTVFTSQLAPYMEIINWGRVYHPRELLDILLGGSERYLAFAREYSKHIASMLKVKGM